MTDSVSTFADLPVHQYDRLVTGARAKRTYSRIMIA